MVKITDPFILRAETTNHSQDVRWVAPNGGPHANQLLTASRDKTARCFSFVDDATDGFHDTLTPEGKPLEGHMGFVNFVMYHPAVPFLDGEAAIITGSNDKYLIFWNPEKGTMEAICGGHSDAVKCAAILYPSMDVVTGSWDKAAIVWDIATGDIKQHFLHHEQSILSIAQVGPRTDPTKQMVVTASGDRTLVCWDANTAAVKATYKAHTDSVQAVVAIGDSGRFASAGNDGRIAIWHMDVATPLSFLHGHESLVFSLCYLDKTNELASAADDRTVKVWGIDDASNELVCSQVINFPVTVWSVCVIDDHSGGEYSQGLATGTADATVRLWSRNMDMCANPEKIAALEALVSAQRVDVKALVASGYKVAMDDIAPLATCNDVEGQYEGERKLFKTDDGLVEVYTWATGTWEKIGLVVVGDEPQVPYRGVIPKQKFFFDGQEWDYLLDIDFGGGRSAKLPYRSGESIFDAAQRFINNNTSLGARQDHKEAIQNHIMKSLSDEDLAKIGVSSGTAGGAGGGSVAFSAYAQEAAELARQGIQETPSWGQAKQQFETRGGDVAFSTFAQEEAAAARAAAMGGVGSPNASSSANPMQKAANCVSSVELFLPLDAAAVKKKTAELAGGNQYDGAIDATFAAVSAKGSNTLVLETACEGLVAAFAGLNQGSRFPAIDALRYLATVPIGAAYVASPEARCAELLDASLLRDKAVEEVLTSEPERLVALRLFANIAGVAPAAAAVPNDSNNATLVPFLTKVLEYVVRPMVKRPTINANQKLAAIAVLQNIAVNFPKLVVGGGATEEAVDALAKSFFLAASEAILFEKDVATQAKYLDIANTVIVAVGGGASSSAASSSAAAAATYQPNIKAHATRSLQRFCQGTMRHVDRTLATAAAAVYQYVKPADDAFE